jgi:hypothetical protein
LRELAKGALAGTVRFGSPVSDFSRLFENKSNLIVAAVSQKAPETTDDRGLLDFQSDLEENFDVVNKVLEDAAKRFQILIPAVLAATEQLGDASNASAKKR